MSTESGAGLKIASSAPGGQSRRGVCPGAGTPKGARRKRHVTRASWLLPVLLVLLASACGESPASRVVKDESQSPVSAIPDKTVVLTFDDVPRSHLDFVAPLLVEKGFGATFFATAAFMEQEEYLDWEGVATLHRMGFEIGNHTRGHYQYCDPRQAPHLESSLAAVDAALAAVGVPTPVSFAWPGDAFGPDARIILERLGYRLARRGMQPECPPGGDQPGPVFDPTRHDHLLVPSTYIAHSRWTTEQFARIVKNASGGRAVVLQFHGVPDPVNNRLSVTPERFREFMDHLDHAGYHVIALRDLLPWIEPFPPSHDAMRFATFPL